MSKGIVKKIINHLLSKQENNWGFYQEILKEKIDPYLRPLYDALEDCMYKDKISKLIEREKIEIAPLSFYERKNFVILLYYIRRSSKHNSMQMKMFLTRLGKINQKWSLQET